MLFDPRIESDDGLLNLDHSDDKADRGEGRLERRGPIELCDKWGAIGSVTHND
jgi:hypothetical protein